MSENLNLIIFCIPRVARDICHIRPGHMYDSSQFVLLRFHQDSDQTDVNIRSNPSQNEI